MLSRPASRLLILDETNRLLLFHYVHTDGPLVGHDFWATPGGTLEEGETYVQAAIRELREETGLQVNAVGAEVAQREVIFRHPDGYWVTADERYFLVRAKRFAPSNVGWTSLETRVMTEWRWWTLRGLATTTKVVWPANLLAMIRTLDASLTDDTR